MTLHEIWVVAYSTNDLKKKSCLLRNNYKCNFEIFSDFWWWCIDSFFWCIFQHVWNWHQKEKSTTHVLYNYAIIMVDSSTEIKDSVGKIVFGCGIFKSILQHWVKLKHLMIWLYEHYSSHNLILKPPWTTGFLPNNQLNANLCKTAVLSFSALQETHNFHTATEKSGSRLIGVVNFRKGFFFFQKVLLAFFSFSVSWFFSFLSLCFFFFLQKSWLYSRSEIEMDIIWVSEVRTTQSGSSMFS